MKRKIYAMLLMLIVVLCFALVACGDNGTTSTPSTESDNGITSTPSVETESDNDTSSNNSNVSGGVLTDGLYVYATIYGSDAYSISSSVATGDIVIPSTFNGAPVEKIASGAFEDSKITSVVVPNTITYIGSGAFKGCDSLTSITLPFIGSSSTTSASGYFGYIFGASSTWRNEYNVPSSLKSVVLTEIDNVPESAFYGCKSLTSISLPSSVSSIEDRAFESCSSLTSFTIPNSVADIGNYIFYNCTSLVSVELSIDITYLSMGTFSGCSSLESITLPSNLAVIYASAFHNCISLKSIAIPDSVTTITSAAFFGCSSLTSVTFGSSSCLEIIERVAFYNCSSLTNITIPASVTSIGDSAFKGCSSLTSVVFLDTEGWYFSIYKPDLSSPQNNAAWLSVNYEKYDWYKV